VRIIAKRTLRRFWEGHPNHADARGPLLAWHAEVRRAVWGTPADIKAQFRSASILKSRRAVFNIAGNKYRLVVHVRYDLGRVYVRFIGTHREYDKIDAETI
jgi:mRNA interferase HigB